MNSDIIIPRLIGLSIDDILNLAPSSTNTYQIKNDDDSTISSTLKPMMAIQTELEQYHKINFKINKNLFNIKNLLSKHINLPIIQLYQQYKNYYVFALKQQPLMIKHINHHQVHRFIKTERENQHISQQIYQTAEYPQKEFSWYGVLGFLLFFMILILLNKLFK